MSTRRRHPPEVDYCADCDMEHQHASDCPRHPDYDPTPDDQGDVTSGPDHRERDELVKPR